VAEGKKTRRQESEWCVEDWAEEEDVDWCGGWGWYRHVDKGMEGESLGKRGEGLGRRGKTKEGDRRVRGGVARGTGEWGPAATEREGGRGGVCGVDAGPRCPGKEKKVATRGGPAAGGHRCGRPVEGWVLCLRVWTVLRGKVDG